MFEYIDNEMMQRIPVLFGLKIKQNSPSSYPDPQPHALGPPERYNRETTASHEGRRV